MAKKTKPPAPPPALPVFAVPAGVQTPVTPESLALVDSAGVYQIKMARSVKHGATWLRPNAERIRVTGDTLIALGAAVRSFAPVA